VKAGGFFYIFAPWKRNTKYLGLGAIIEAIQAGTTVDKVYIQKKKRAAN
jgi:hypothetical protein